MNTQPRPLLPALRAWAPALALAACSAACAADHPQLAYVQQNANGRYELRLADPATGQSQRVQLLLAPPQLVIWHRDRPEVITLRENGLYMTDYRKEPGVGNPVGDGAPAGLQLDDAWVAKDGKTVLAVGASSTAAGATTCALYTVPDTGAWRKMPVPKPAPAKGEDDPCGSFAEAERAEARSVSSLQLARRQQCTAPGSPCEQLGGKPGDAYAAVRKAVQGSTKNLEAVAIADPGKTAYVLALGVVIGDAPHLARPVHLVARQGLQLQKPALRTPAQVQLGLRGSWALISEEYTGQDPVVVDLETGKTLWSATKASGAVWLP